MKYDLEKMLSIAKASREQAYAPYSKFPVGVCIFSEEGHYYGGCNVENTSYPQGNCAESTAIGNMIVSGDRKIMAALVLTDTETGVSPCGGCLQKLSEFSGPDTQILIANLTGVKIKKAFKDVFFSQFSDIFAQIKNIHQA